MPTYKHEFPLQMIRDNPRLATQLVEIVSAARLPDGQTVKCDSENLSEVVSTEFRADSVLTVLNSKGGVIAALIVEMQRDFSGQTRDRKRRSWVAYTANLFARHGCPVEILVLCESDEVAAQCREPIHVTMRGFSLRVLAIGPSDLPVVTDSEFAMANPELAVLSGFMHGNGPCGRAVLTALDAALNNDPDPDRAGAYFSYCYETLDVEPRRWLEEMMQTMDRPYYGALARKLGSEARSQGLAEGIAEGRSEGLAEGIAEGRSEGLAEGIAEGRAQGRVEGEANGVIGVLEARGLSVSQRERETILGSQDLEQVRGWLRRAVKVDRTAELFD